MSFVRTRSGSLTGQRSGSSVSSGSSALVVLEMMTGGENCTVVVGLGDSVEVSEFVEVVSDEVAVSSPEVVAVELSSSVEVSRLSGKENVG